MYYGCLKTEDDNRDYKVKVNAIHGDLYPNEFEIIMPDVKDQGIVNSCVAHALSTYMEESEKLERTKFSVGWIYGYRPIGYNQGEGMIPREAIKTLQKIGAVLKKDFDHNKEVPEIINLVNKDLPKLKELASIYKINSYARIYTEDEIKKCVYADVPVPISIPVRGDLELDNNCILLNLDKPITGYHMMIIYGWTNAGWLVQNSWGTDWGDKGRAILPYDYELDSAWAIDRDSNNVYTYQTLWQRIIEFLRKLLKIIKKEV